jgi:hypothetical protein
MLGIIGAIVGGVMSAATAGGPSTFRESPLQPAIGLMEYRRRPGAATFRHHDAVLGCLRSAAFSVDLAARAYSLPDSYFYGFVLNEQPLPLETRRRRPKLAPTCSRSFRLSCIHT